MESKIIPENSILSSCGKYATRIYDGTLQVFELANNQIVLSFPASPLAFSLDGRYLATIDNQIFKVLQIETQKIIFQMNSALVDPEKISGYPTYGERQPPSKETFFRYFLGNRGPEFSGFTVNENNVYFFYENGWMAPLWRLPQNEVNLPPAETRTNVAAISRNGKYFAVQNWFNNIFILDVPNWTEVRHIQNEGRAGGLAFSADGKFIAIVSFGNTIRIIEVSTGQEVYYLRDELIDDNIGEITFSSDGNFIAGIFSSQKGVKIWSLKTENLVSTACSRLTRNLSVGEWKEVFGNAPYQRTCPDLPSPEDLQKNTPEVEDSGRSTNPPDVIPIPLTFQPPSKPAEKTPPLTISPSPSPSTSSSKSKFPQTTCGDKSAPPNARWYPVLIDDGSVDLLATQRPTSRCVDLAAIALR